MIEVDVAVIGGGPGGSSAAFFLQHIGRGEKKILLIERLQGDRYSRYHRMCGEGISELGLREIRPIRPHGVINRISRIQITWPDGSMRENRARGCIIDRVEFLRRLHADYEAIGGEILFGSVAGIELVPKGYLMTLSSGERVRAGFIVGADGCRSLVRRSLFDEEPPISIMARQYVIRSRSAPDTLRFKVSRRYGGGYRWEFPCGENSKIGFPHGTDELEGDIIEEHARLVSAGGLRRIVSGNACLVGEAAGQSNPLTFAGIRPAMTAGRRAAESILADDTERYQRWWERSRLSSPSFLESWRLLQRMSDEDVSDLVRPFQRWYGLLLFASDYLRNPRRRPLYHAYLTMGRWAW